MTGTGVAREIPAGIRAHDGLVSMVREMIDDPGNGFREYRYAGFFPGGWTVPDDGRPAGKNISLVMSEDTAVELGAPSEKSVSLLLRTGEEETIPEGIWTAGADLSRIRGRSVSYAQIFMAQLRPGAGPLNWTQRSLMNLTNRIPGCMTRSLQGRIWIRIHKDLLARGFSLSDIGETMLSLYRKEASDAIVGAGVVLVADDSDLVSRIEKIQAMARVINGENRKLQMEEDGSVTCEDLNCGSCGEKDFCDTLRDVISARRDK